MLNWLGSIYIIRKETVAAETLLKEALSIATTYLGPDHPTTAAVLYNYAALFRKTGRKCEARNMKARMVQTNDNCEASEGTAPESRRSVPAYYRPDT